MRAGLKEIDIVASMGKPQGGSYFGGGLSRGFAGLRLGL